MAQCGRSINDLCCVWGYDLHHTSLPQTATRRQYRKWGGEEPPRESLYPVLMQPPEPQSNPGWSAANSFSISGARFSLLGPLILCYSQPCR